MSDENNKLVRQSHSIAPAEDFARKIEERLRAEPVPAVERECLYAFKYERGVISRCNKTGAHSDHQNGFAFWKGICNAVSVDGEPCVYQIQHEGDHGNGRDTTWAQQEIAQVGVDEFNLAGLGEALRGSPAFEQYVAQRAAGNRPVLSRQPLKMARSYSLGLGPMKIAPGMTETATVRPAMYFKAEKLLVSDPELMITSMWIGMRKQPFDNVSTAFFSPNSLGSGMPFDTAQPGIDISIVVRNPTAIERTFVAEIIGKGITQ